jgi:HEAT repeat protein
MGQLDEQVVSLLNRIEPDYRGVAELGPPVLAVLQERLQSTDPHIRSRAVYAVAALAEKLPSDPESQALEQVTSMAEAATHDEDVVVRLAGAVVGHALPPTSALRVHINSLKDLDPGVRKTALEMAPAQVTEEHAKLFKELEVDDKEHGAVRKMARILHETHPRHGDPGEPDRKPDRGSQPG